nr:hypothetical protein Iba_chr06bCG17070 [Ipomoea batatas]
MDSNGVRGVANLITTLENKDETLNVKVKEPTNPFHSPLANSPTRVTTVATKDCETVSITVSLRVSLLMIFSNTSWEHRGESEKYNGVDYVRGEALGIKEKREKGSEGQLG